MKDKMSPWEDKMMAIAPPLTSQTGHRHGPRFEEETRERLSSLIRRTPFERFSCAEIGDSYWTLLADSSRDRFVRYLLVRYSMYMHNSPFTGELFN